MNSGKKNKKNGLYDGRLPGIRWRFPRKPARWFGMTMLFDALTSLYKFPICVPQNDTERVRVGTITDHARHDLAVGPADKFPISRAGLL